MKKILSAPVTVLTLALTACGGNSADEAASSASAPKASASSKAAAPSSTSSTSSPSSSSSSSSSSPTSSSSTSSRSSSATPSSASKPSPTATKKTPPAPLDSVWNPATGNCTLLIKNAPTVLGGPLAATEYEHDDGGCWAYGAAGGASGQSIAALNSYPNDIATVAKRSEGASAPAPDAPGKNGTWTSATFEGTTSRSLLWTGDDGKTWGLNLTQSDANTAAAKQRMLKAAKTIDAYIVKNSAASPGSGKADKSIEKVNWGSTQHRIKLLDRTVTLRQGEWMNRATMNDVQFKANDPTAVTYGDVNSDGIEDAVVTLHVGGGNHVTTEVSLWLGTKSGKPVQQDVAFAGSNDCMGYSITSMTINDAGIITFRGKGPRTDGPCAGSMGAGDPYTATFRYTDGSVHTITPPPSVG